MKRYWQINQYIKSEELRVVDEKGEQIGVMSKDKALALAREEGIDLVEVASKAKPPVAKLIDFVVAAPVHEVDRIASL